MTKQEQGKMEGGHEEAPSEVGRPQDQASEPREHALSRVEHDTAGQQERTHRQVVREDQEAARKTGRAEG